MIIQLIQLFVHRRRLIDRKHVKEEKNDSLNRQEKNRNKKMTVTTVRLFALSNK